MVNPLPAPLGSDRKFEAIGITQAEATRAVRKSGGLHVERAPTFPDPAGELVYVLRGSDLQGEAHALNTFTFGAIVLREQQANVAGHERNRDQFAVALVLPFDREAKDVLIPGQAALQVIDGQRSGEGTAAKRLRACALGRIGRQW